MTTNPFIRFLTENRRLPTVINIGLHAVSINILYSFLLMSTSVFLLRSKWDAVIVQETIPIVGYLAPYSFYTVPDNFSYVWGAAAMIWIWVTWLFSTRISNTNKTVLRRMFSFSITWISSSLIIIFYSLRIIKVMGYEKVVSLHYTIEPQYQEIMSISSLQIIGFLLMFIPIAVMVSFTLWLIGQYQEDTRIKEWFRTYKFERGWMGRFGDETINQLPDIQLARNAETNAPVVMQGESRQLGTLLIGPPGSGKTSIKIKTAFKTDLGHIQRMINAYPTYKKRYGFGTEEFVKKMANHLIGSIIIEPAKDLCDDAYELVKDHNIPEEFIVYLDPSNPKTPGFNMMVGPTSEVVETITAVLESVAETKDEFFKQAARSVLKHYVYLLKFSKGDDCTILDLDDLYQDPRKAMDLLEELEKKVPTDDEVNNMDQDGRIYWIIVKKIVRWFRNEGLSIQTSRDGMVEKYPSGHEHEGKLKVNDLQFEFTRQTRNLLSDITKNPYLARILYAENEVDLNRIFTKGGILLVNTDLGNLKALSSIFGKLVLLCVQNAVFRRKGTEKTRPMVSFYADEFYDYMNEDFLQLTSQGRKYKFAPLVACQSLTQFGVKFGKDFTESMLGTIRNTIVYGGTSLYDTEMLSKYLGTEVVEELQTRESFSPSYMDSPSFSVAETLNREEKEIATSDDIMFQEFRYSYIRLVDDKSSKRAIRAVGDFVDTSEAEKWKKAINNKALEMFLEDWKKEETENDFVKNTDEDEHTSLHKDLASLNAEEENTETINDDSNTISNDRFKTYVQQGEGTAPSRDKYFKESRNEVAAAVEELKDVPVETETIKSKVVPDEVVEKKTPPPAVASPFVAAKIEEKKSIPTTSFSAAFGSKEKEKITSNKNTATKQSNSFTSAFSKTKTSDEDLSPVKTEESSTLKDVPLDDQALNFLNKLRETDED
ncbi:hypothetical protein BKP35_16485 [Anaerobacillus arseniciselenatis]|uniref:TraD/TraG TraM recognition site domain-containing protein n=1 Tax=Anaerobacillus arseniciselenatis TaxID=85682 RepID=A0A1S2LAN4_9BACI|nr:TraM recognition domain-containing protein [Anaerobacillus arseniciselenatis]OIJ09451.1 hypothetical protein BKP35_16485 [Anaerobacillus arseniciselenatis]